MARIRSHWRKGKPVCVHACVWESLCMHTRVSDLDIGQLLRYARMKCEGPC